MSNPFEHLRYCAVCDMEFDGDTKFAVIGKERICEDCIRRMDVFDLLERAEIEVDCIGFPEGDDW